MWKLSLGAVAAASLAAAALPTVSSAEPAQPPPCAPNAAYEPGCPYDVTPVTVSPERQQRWLAERRAEAAHAWRQTQARQAEQVLRMAR